MKAKHKRTVQFCPGIKGEMVDYEVELVLANLCQRFLFFEYLPKGSLDKKITDAYHGHEWTRQYQIMKGICDGLYYLHIVQLDMKPTNILLDFNEMPKIADFGISRCFDEKQSWVITSNLIGTIGYLAPELYVSGQITFKSDIYSLGVIIMEILTGKKNMSPNEKTGYTTYNEYASCNKNCAPLPIIFLKNK
uniref:Uncharacterized protein n=5 Tax=Avena sativa TaxID=4498 RepID=A0ACD5W9C3_AVESA